MVTIAASASKTVYLAPGTWNVGGERYALCLLSNPQVWVDFTDADGDGVYTATFDDSSCTQMVICRMNGSNTENRWNNEGETGDDRPMWNQTQDINISVIDGLTYTINNWDGDNGKSGYSTSGDTYLYNVGANAYLENGASWGTHAALKSSGFVVNVSMNNGKYTIGTNSKYAGKHLGTNAYVDNGDNNAKDWNLEAVDGHNAFKLKTDGGLYIFSAAGMYNVELGADPGTNKAYWRFVTATKRDDVSGATNLTPVELTHKITNPRFDEYESRNSKNYVKDWPDNLAWGGNTSGSNGDVPSWDDRNPCGEQYNKTFDTYQELTGLANGTYAVSVQGFYREGGYAAAAEKHLAGTESLNALLYANDETEPLMSIFEGAGKASGGGTATATGIEGAFPNNMNAASYWFSAGLYWNTVYVTVNDGTLKFGVKKTTSVGSDWTIFDNFRLQYFGNCSIAEAKNGALIVAYNEALANAQSFENVAMEASVKSGIVNALSTYGNLDTTTATAEELTAATAALNDAAAVAEPSAHLYAEIRILLNGLKAQDAEFDRETKYNAGEYTAISEVYTEYYTFATDKLGTVPNTDFTKAIVNPGFEFGNTLGWTYATSIDHGAKSTSNSTYAMQNSEGDYLFNIWDAGHTISQTISNLPTGLYELKAVIANGGAKVYLIANDVHEGFTTNAEGYIGTEVSVKVAVTDGNLTIGASGCNNDDDQTFSEVGVWWYKVDNFRLFYYGDVVTDEDAAALLATVPTGKMNSDVQTALNNAVSAFESHKSTDNYQALHTAIENANASIEAYTNAKSAIDEAKDIQEKNNVVTAAAATTFAEAIAAIETPYNNGTLSNDDANNAGNSLGVVVSGWHANANGAAVKYMESAWDMPGNFEDYYINTWSTEGNSDGSNFKVPFVEYWIGSGSLNAKTLTATQEGLTPNGIYTVSVWARVAGSSKVANSITLQVGEGSTTDLTAGPQIGSTGRYLDTFAATGLADADGKLTIKINVAAESNINWLSFKNVKYTEVESASSEDYDALANAIATAEANTLGFEVDEYAPYNNVAAIEALTAAKAIDADAVNAKADVEAATTALTNATWTANTEEVNAFYDGDFSECAEDNQSPLDYIPAGWSASDNMRMMLKNTETYPGLNDASAKSAMMAWSGGITYGEAGGYEMPLKANTVYVLKLRAAGWNDESRSGITVSVLNAEDGLAATNLGTPDRDIKAAQSWNTAGMTYYEAYFETGAAGNYVFHVQSGNNMVLTDFDLRRCDDVFAVVGSKKDNDEDKAIFSNGWDQATQTDILTLSNGAYTKTYTDQELDAQTIAFKVISKAAVESTEAKAWYPQDNQEVNIPVKGRYNITFTFMNGTVKGEATKTAEAVTIGEKGWATTVTNSPLDFSESGVEAYTATVNESGKVELTKVDDVQAETGLVLKATANTYYLPVIESSETDKGSLMFSSTLTYDIWQPTDGTVNTFYGLTVNSEKKAQFVKISGGTIPAQKAFLLINSPAEGARTLSVVFAGDATGINTVIAEKNVEGIYNMNGQRVTAPAKGLYIMNGKKVILK